MLSNFPRPAASSLNALRQFARKRSAAESCDLCGNELALEHDHLVQPATRKLVCACGACAILFENQDGGQYKRVPQRVQLLKNFQMTDHEWAILQIPIELAFFFHSTAQERIVALYPSPAGAMESQISAEAWAGVVKRNPLLVEMPGDVMALLACRVRLPGASKLAVLAPPPTRSPQQDREADIALDSGESQSAAVEAGAEYYLAPIDQCYRLVGLMRTHWRGFSGGGEVWNRIATFFAALRQRSEIVGGGAHA